MLGRATIEPIMHKNAIKYENIRFGEGGGSAQGFGNYLPSPVHFQFFAGGVRIARFRPRGGGGGGVVAKKNKSTEIRPGRNFEEGNPAEQKRVKKEIQKYLETLSKNILKNFGEFFFKKNISKGMPNLTKITKLFLKNLGSILNLKEDRKGILIRFEKQDFRKGIFVPLFAILSSASSILSTSSLHLFYQCSIDITS